MHRLSLLIALLVALVINMFCVEAMAEKRIGILSWNEQARYISNKDGVVDYLKQHGFAEPDVKFTIASANANKATAAELARKFIADKMDLVITIGTSATVIAANEIKDIPIVFVMVWDPIESKIAKAWQSSGNNTTGASSKTSTSGLLAALKKLAPANNVAVLYTPGEKNSEIILKEFEAEQDNFKIKVVPVPMTDKEAIPNIMADVVTSVEAICLGGSSIVGDNLPIIVDIATKAKVITSSQSEDLVERGALLGVTVDPYAVGQLAGEKAVKVLRGAHPSSIPIEPLKKLDLILNMKTAESGHFQIPPEFMQGVTRTIE